jgi:hypothetical protein
LLTLGKSRAFALGLCLSLHRAYQLTSNVVGVVDASGQKHLLEICRLPTLCGRLHPCPSHDESHAGSMCLPQSAASPSSFRGLCQATTSHARQCAILNYPDSSKLDADTGVVAGQASSLAHQSQFLPGGRRLSAPHCQCGQQRIWEHSRQKNRHRSWPMLLQPRKTSSANFRCLYRCLGYLKMLPDLCWESKRCLTELHLTILSLCRICCACPAASRFR